MVRLYLDYLIDTSRSSGRRMNTTDIINPLNESSSDVKEEGLILRKKIINGSVFVVSLTGIILNYAAIYTLRKCRRLPFQIKWLSCNLFMTDIVLQVVVFCITSSVLQLGQTFLDQVFHLRVVVGMMMALVTLVSVSGVILERLIALTKTMIYSKIFTETRVALLLVYIWVPHVLMPLTMFIVPVYFICDMDISLDNCNTRLVMLPFRLFIAVSYALYHSFIIYAYVIIFRIMKRHEKAITQHNNMGTIEKSSSTKSKSDTTTHKVIRIVLVFEIIYIPLFMYMLISAFVPDFQDNLIQAVFHGVSYACSCSNGLINMYLYVWKMRECRLVFLNTFFSWNQRCRAMAHALRLEVYPYVPNEMCIKHRKNESEY